DQERRARRAGADPVGGGRHRRCGRRRWGATVRSSHTVRGEVAACARELHARGWVANHDGNVTARDGALLIATPTATSKRLVSDRGLIEVDLAGKAQGGARVFGEIGLHVVVYERRPH